MHRSQLAERPPTSAGLPGSAPLPGCLDQLSFFAMKWTVDFGSPTVTATARTDIVLNKRSTRALVAAVWLDCFETRDVALSIVRFI